MGTKISRRPPQGSPETPLGPPGSSKVPPTATQGPPRDQFGHILDTFWTHLELILDQCRPHFVSIWSSCGTTAGAFGTHFRSMWTSFCIHLEFMYSDIKHCKQRRHCTHTRSTGTAGRGVHKMHISSNKHGAHNKQNGHSRHKTQMTHTKHPSNLSGQTHTPLSGAWHSIAF